LAAGGRTGMNPDTAAAAPLLNIATVERDTRIGKDTLRAWERRYGFPQPQRDANGERAYPPEQLARLRIVKRLLDAGHRPRRVVALPLDDLLQLVAAPSTAALAAPAGGDPARSPAPHDEPVQRLMALLRRHDPAALRRALNQSLQRAGLAHFVVDVAMPLLQAVGRAWADGELQVYEEHLCSEVLETTLRAALAAAPEAAPDARPRVLLSTVVGEWHSLSLLMAEAMFSVEGCACINLGRQTPLQDLAAAALAHRADIVALSFSAAGNVNHAADALAGLRALLPTTVALWAGSPQVALHRRGIAGVQLLERLDQIPEQLGRWRAPLA
jgi:DNA-binding transcriptional MerR regulator/methylmalonyl-CoA mutase cobalamin-binding subunit